MKLKIKNKIYLSKTNTDAGFIITLQGSQKLNRLTTLYYAAREDIKGRYSIFFIVRPKDCRLLEDFGYSIRKIKVPAGQYPISLNYGTYTKLELASI